MHARKIFSASHSNGWRNIVAKVTAVRFKNAAGQTLFGTLHEPAAVNPALPVVVLLSPGVKMRVGPGRLYVPLTQMLCEQGYAVFRFDFFGLGDSEGELKEKMLSDVYNHIEVGRYVDDTVAALRWLRESFAAKRFVLGGLCGGAITALLAAQKAPDAEGLLSLGMTVTLAGNAVKPGNYLTTDELAVHRKLYLKKVFSPYAWWRLMTAQSNYSIIWHSVLRVFAKKKLAKAAAVPATMASTAAPTTVEQRGNANPMFPQAYFAFLRRGGKAFMLFSGKDRLQSEYEEKFALPFAEQLAPFGPQIERHLVSNANHVLSQHEWQREMVESSRLWMLKHFAV
jgi:alpha/beta superfamily hydrolase